MNETDTTGRDRLAKNVTASYLGHFVFIILGFVMPRMIDNHVGQAGLGVWDFSWSFVSYLSLSMVGIGSSINRYVAKYRAEDATDKMCRLVSSVVALQLLVATSVFLVSVGLFFAVPMYFQETLGELTDTASWVVALLGTSLAVQMAFDAWRGVLSGCHRWDLYNAINAGGYAVTAVGMVIVLYSGGGLKGIATTYLVMTFAVELLRYIVARRVCPELRISAAAVNKKDAKMAFRFGLKTIILAVPGILVIQTVNLFIVASLGPAILAVLARPLSLVHHVTTLVNKYSFVLTPMAGSLHGSQNKSELREFSLDHARVGWVLAIAPLTFLFVYGDVVLEFWMGPDYAFWSTTALLSAGYLVPISQSPVLRILIGMDEHGRVAKRSAIIAIFILSVGIAVASQIGWSIDLAATIVALAVGLSTGVTVFFHGFSTLGWTAKEYMRVAGWNAIFLLFSLLASLTLTRVLLTNVSSILALSIGALVAAIVFVSVQHRDVRRILERFGRKKPSSRSEP